MEAKDTVIKIKKVPEQIWVGRKDTVETKMAYLAGFKDASESQAEISFKVGVNVGYSAGKIDGQYTNHKRHSIKMEQAKSAGYKDGFGAGKLEERKKWMECLKIYSRYNGTDNCGYYTISLTEYQKLLKELESEK